MKKFSFEAFDKITPYNYLSEVRLSVIDYLKEHGLTPAKIKKKSIRDRRFKSQNLYF